MTAPRMVRAEKLRAYLDLPKDAPLSAVPVQPLRIGQSQRWDLRAVDAWLDGLSGFAPSSPPSTAPAAVDPDDPEALFAGWLSDRGEKREATGRA